MCGIAGSIERSLHFDEFRVDEGALHEALRTRGPDAWAQWREQEAYLAHARLAIIDVSRHAAQPMASACGRYMLVFNGEIYNFGSLRRELGDGIVWRSHSDSEVLVEAFARWGIEKCLERLQGMFAFAIWDRQERRLTLARDRLGVKPLYYLSDVRRFAFASRPRALALFAPPAALQPDRQALRLFVEAGYIPAPWSFHRGIRKLLPGHYLEVQKGCVREHRYWSLDGIVTDPDLERASEARLLEELGALIDDSVRLRLVSDVPLGAFLSGGIDSSIVVESMSRLAGTPPATFTIGFDDEQFDESDKARAIAAHLGTRHTTERLHSADLLALMPEFERHYDEPFYDYSAFPAMAVSRLAARSVKVSLSGDGGDEAFGGYHYYRLAQKFSMAHALPAAVRSAFARIGTRLPGRLAFVGHALARDSVAASFAFARSVCKDADTMLAPSLRADTCGLGELFEARASRLDRRLDPAEVGMRLDIGATLPDDYLQKVDVGSMAFSLEARDPMLDHRIFEWAARLPVRWKLGPEGNKHLLRRLAYQRMPRSLLDGPKRGFGVPMARWLRRDLKAWALELLSDDQALAAFELLPGEVRRLWDEHQSCRRDRHTALWAVLALLVFNRGAATWRPLGSRS